jgi:hypothetical protein
MSDSIFSLSKKDVMGGKVYEPAWYRVRIDDYSNGPSKNLEKPSINHTYQGTILFDADSGDRKYEEHPLTWMFNSRAMGFTKGFLIALGVPEESITPDARFDFKSAVGKEIDIYVENDTYEGRLVNRVNHKYRAPRAA